MTRNTVTAASGVQVHATGSIRPDELEYVRSKVAKLLPLASAPVLFARVTITVHADRAMSRPVHMKASLDVNGRVLRAQVGAPTPHEAADALQDRLRQAIERLAHKPDASRRRMAGAEWHHGDEHRARPTYFARPREERTVVRHKSYAIGAATAEEAADTLELLDHDFFLFHDLETGVDEVIARRGDGGYTLYSSSSLTPIRLDAPSIEPAPIRPTAMSTEAAITLLDGTEKPFVFFLDERSGRGRVMYRRYDGHYGLIEPADA